MLQCQKHSVKILQENFHDLKLTFLCTLRHKQLTLISFNTSKHGTLKKTKKLTWLAQYTLEVIVDVN